MNTRNTGSLLSASPVGFASGEIILDPQGSPVDFTFHESNPAFESMSPSWTGGCLDWLSRFAACALKGEIGEYDVHSPETGKWYRITLSSPEKGFFTVLASDITALKASADLTGLCCVPPEVQESLEAEKQRYFYAFQSTSQPILITDATGNIISVNQALTDMYGYSQEELLGRSPSLLNPGRDVYENLGVSVFEYDSLFRELWRSVLDPAVGTWQGEVINRSRKGNLLWVNLVVNAIYDENGALQSIVGLPIDMTGTRESGLENRVQLYRTIADLAELRDDDTGNHLKRVGIFAKLLARGLGLREKYCSDIEIFAPLHDIGKVGILDSILRAPRRLSEDEFSIMKTHTTLGHNIVKGKSEFEMAAAITLCHHERYDGRGYPNGLEGKHIPLSAQITAVCDVYDALRSRRPYKEPWTHEDTVRHLYEQSGTHFDPDIVHVFLKFHDRFESVYHELADA